MTPEEKQLLMSDLCARLPYKVKISVTEPERTEFTNQFSYENGRTLIGVLYAIFPDEERIIVDELDKPIAPDDVRCGGFNIEKYKIKPYLRPIESMTDEEIAKMWEVYENNPAAEGSSKITDLLNKWGLDHHHLIEKGLAEEDPDGMYETE